MRVSFVILLVLAAVACGGWTPAHTEGATVATRGGLRITVLVSHYGGRVDWGKNNLIAFDRIGKDGWFDLWTMQPDGSDQRRLSCISGAPEYIRGRVISSDVSWSPDGTKVVAYIQDNGTKDQPGSVIRIDLE